MNEYTFSSFFYSSKVTPHPLYNETSAHIHEKYEILHFESGSAELILEGKKHLLHPDSLLLIPPHTRHHIKILSDVPYSRSVINFDNLGNENFAPLFESTRVIDISKNARALNVLARAKDYVNLFENVEKQMILSLLCAELLLIIKATETEKKSIQEFGAFLAEALKYIEKNIQTIKDVDELCDALHVSRAYLYREFRLGLDVSPKKYINRKRLNIARDLLTLGEDATKVCYRCGYSDYSGFYRAYKAHFGHSPQETILRHNL